MEKNINIVFAQEDGAINVLEVSYVQPEFSNDHPAIYELKMIEKILEGEYFEDFVNLNLPDFVKRKINQDKNFGSPVTDIGMFSAESTDFRERTYLINVPATGANFEFGVYDSGDEWELNC